MMVAKDNVVLQGRLPEGAVVGPEEANLVLQAGGATIPVAGAWTDGNARIPDPIVRNGVGGYQVRRWGLGWDLGRVPVRVCPMVLFVEPGCRYVHWRACVAPNGKAPHDGSGHVRVVGDSGQRLVTGGFSSMGSCAASLAVPELAEDCPDPFWIVGGDVEYRAPQELYLGLAFWAAGEGLSVLWTAASQSDG